MGSSGRSEFQRPLGRLQLSPAIIDECRAIAAEVCGPVIELAESHTTRSIERASLRIVGFDGAVGTGADAVPLANLVQEAVEDELGLDGGVLLPVFHAALRTGRSHSELARMIADRSVAMEWPEGPDLDAARAAAREAIDQGLAVVDEQRHERERLIAELGEPSKPWFYVIVATGNIYEDTVQGQAAARSGGDIISVIRSTGQSLLDYVPEGPTTEGYGGTYATQENFRLMRVALDSASRELNRYVRQCSYASGLCMPEMAVLAGVERLDVMLNDCMYGIIFRDINMKRTFVDQHFSRRLHAFAGIAIHTGEDNYLTTADAVEAAHTVLASHFLNESLALSAGLPIEHIGLGHAFEIDPAEPDQIALGLAHAQLHRECFPDSPLKWMPPTRYLTGDIFQAFLYNGIYNLIGSVTGYDVTLLGMLSEGIHTPFLADRELAIRNASYVYSGSRVLSGDLHYAPGGFVHKRANSVLAECCDMLDTIRDIGLFGALEAGFFADTKRERAGGKGLDGVVKKSNRYWNGLVEKLDDRLGRTGK